jgi:hypothetical protein
VRLLVAASLAVAVLDAGSASPPTQDPSSAATTLLDQYLAGQFEVAIGSLSAVDDYAELLEQLKRDGPTWLNGGGAGQRERRELAAATFALEAARLGAWTTWKEVGVVPIVDPDRPLEAAVYRLTYWKAPPLLIEWACELVRQRERPGATEHLWQLAAVAVAERAQDYQFLAGDQKTPRLNPTFKILNDATIPIIHLAHVRQRFPDEPRFKLAEGIAEEWYEPLLARKVFDQLKDDIDVGGEATMRLGAMAYRARDDGGAIALFRRVEPLTRDPWVIHLARYFTGLAEERRNRPADAERALRAALAAVPRAESASIALGSLLFRTGRRAEGSLVIESMLTAAPKPRDPWRTYADADDRFWPELLARLRKEIRP